MKQDLILEFKSRLRIFLGKYYWRVKELISISKKEDKYFLNKIKYKNNEIKIYSKKLQSFYSMASGTFKNEEYKWLDVKGKDVIDIGANIGDTAIYFALNGAKRVYAFEPYPATYETAQKNTMPYKNIILYNMAVGEKTKLLNLGNTNSEAAGADLSHKGNEKIAQTTLEKFCNINNFKHAILKIDCEGAEYEIILNSSSSTLLRFDQIMIEYHYGYKTLKKYLENAGFKVTVTVPAKFFNIDAKNPYMNLGLLYAKKSKDEIKLCTF